MVHGLFAEVGVYAALHNGEEALAVAIERLGFTETLGIALQPALGEVQALAGV